jgi:hypothetical protein
MFSKKEKKEIWLNYWKQNHELAIEDHCSEKIRKRLLEQFDQNPVDPAKRLEEEARFLWKNFVKPGNLHESERIFFDYKAGVPMQPLTRFHPRFELGHVEKKIISESDSEEEISEFHKELWDPVFQNDQKHLKFMTPNLTVEELADQDSQILELERTRMEKLSTQQAALEKRVSALEQVLQSFFPGSV